MSTQVAPGGKDKSVEPNLALKNFKATTVNQSVRSWPLPAVLGHTGGRLAGVYAHD